VIVVETDRAEAQNAEMATTHSLESGVASQPENLKTCLIVRVVLKTQKGLDHLGQTCATLRRCSRD
jgi:hypothetical protein